MIRCYYAASLVSPISLAFSWKATDGRTLISFVNGDPDQWARNKTVTYQSFVSPIGLSHFSGLACSHADRAIFYTDLNKRKIYEYIDVGSSFRTTAITDYSTRESHGIAFDWIARNLYWTDMYLGRINIVEAKVGGLSRYLFSISVYKPAGIAVYPQKGYLFWSDWGTSPKIERSTLAGKNRLTLKSSLWKPLGLLVDHGSDQLYWVDGIQDVLYRMSTAGGLAVRMRVWTGVQLKGIALHKNHIFLTETNGGRVYTIDKSTGANVHITALKGVRQFYDITMCSAYRQPSSNGNPCRTKGCSYICVSAAYNQAECICRRGYVLSSDGKTCKVNTLLSAMSLAFSWKATDGRSLVSFVNGDPDQWVRNKTVTYQSFVSADGALHFSGLACSHADREIFYTDLNKMKIYKYIDVGSSFQVTAITAYSTRESHGIAFDWIAKNLYWTDINLGRINIAEAKVGGLSRSLFSINVDKPAGIAVYPQKGYLFWSDWGTRPKIERSTLAGKSRLTLLILGATLLKPLGLVVDHGPSRLYWVDGIRDSLYMMSTTGGIASRLRGWTGGQLQGIALHKNHLFLTETNGGHLYAIDKNTGANVSMYTVPGVRRFYDITMCSAYRQPSSNSNPCRWKGCSYICVSAAYNQVECICRIGSVLLSDGRTCKGGTTNVSSGVGGSVGLLIAFFIFYWCCCHTKT